MIVLKKYFFVIGVLFFINNTKAQESSVYLKNITDSIRFSKIETNRFLYNDTFKRVLNSELIADNAFDYSWDSIKNTVSVLESADKKLKVITWVVLTDKQEYYNYGLVLYKKKSSSPFYFYWLSSKKLEKIDPLYEDLTADLWQGALYYQIHDFKRKKQNYYCVVGFDGADKNKNLKIIDVLWVDKSNELHIGAPVFYSNKNDFTPQYRVVFEYADQSVMLLRFEKELNVIAFSNINPSNREKLGNYSYYIPDGRIDFYLKNKKGKWIRHEDFEEWDKKNKRIKKEDETNN